MNVLHPNSASRAPKDSPMGNAKNTKLQCMTSVSLHQTLLACVLAIASLSSLASEEHDHSEETAVTEQASVHLSDTSLQLAGVEVTQLVPQQHNYELVAPAEIKANGYNSYVVSVRTESVVIARHVTLGEHVNEQQPLVTLFSEQMAQAQGDYLVAASEWQRLSKLDSSSISAANRVKAQSNYNASYGRLLAMGLTDAAIAQISQENRARFGQYQLVAQISGSVLSDDFIQGQRVQPGDTLLTIADEQTLWVEAKLSPQLSSEITQTTPVHVTTANGTFPARVIQEAHVIDPQTRTRIIRLEVQNIGHVLHAGMFVSAQFTQTSKQSMYAVPQEALTRNAQGQWQIFVQANNNKFLSREVQLGAQFGELQQILGVHESLPVVTKNAFFVASELARSVFDPHNH